MEKYYSIHKILKLLRHPYLCFKRVRREKKVIHYKNQHGQERTKLK